MANKKNRLGRLVRKSDFERLKKYGIKAQINSWLILKALPSREGQTKFGWTIPTQTGTAVTRNKIKRWCREYFRSRNLSELTIALDINVIVLGVRKDPGFLKQMDHDEFTTNLERTFEKILRHRWAPVRGDSDDS
ncbi:MAG: ribonuclease P protein component [Bdellovibrionales bacterium]|nr:ribonuclease P protein component [Bdellovibrionales bacterium]